MKEFEIQTINNQIKHDFSFQLMRSIEFWEWFHQRKEFNFKFCESKSDINCIPVGSVEFVVDHIKRKTGKEPKPINVPECLFSHAGREIKNTNKEFILSSDDDLFIKSNEKIKDFSTFSDEIDPDDLKNVEYQVSGIVDIYSEYRCFVYRNKLLDIRRYSGDFDIFPDVDTVLSMIQKFKNEAPVAYTLDVGVLKRGKTIVIEVHDFFSCGLYGFEDKMYPMMLIDWYNEFMRRSLCLK